MLLVEGVAIRFLYSLSIYIFFARMLDHDGSIRSRVSQVQIPLALDLLYREAHVNKRLLVHFCHLRESLLDYIRYDAVFQVSLQRLFPVLHYVCKA